MLLTAARADAWSDCAQPHDRDLIIQGCSAIIASGRESQENLWRAYYNRGLAYSDLGDERAIGDFDEVIALRPNFADAYIQRGLANHAAGQAARVPADFDKAIELRPDYFVAYVLRGALRFENQEWDLAIADFDRVIRLMPDWSAGHLSRGAAYAGKREYDRAIVDYDKAVELEPDFADAYTGRGAGGTSRRVTTLVPWLISIRSSN